jgi:hypothetical protein
MNFDNVNVNQWRQFAMKIMGKTLVSIVMGSDSDLEIMREAGKALENLGLLMRWMLRRRIDRRTGRRISRGRRRGAGFR